MQNITVPLIGPLGRYLDRTAGSLLGSAPGLSFDFTMPPGEAALVDCDGVSWRVFKNPVTMFIGGVAAVLLELAEPRVRDGVWAHSSFRTDPLTRMRRTGLAAMITVYGPRSKAEPMIAAVVRAHEAVRGRTREGLPYHASDPELLDWVQATASYGFLYAYHCYAKPLSDAERDAVLAEGQLAAQLYGATGAPTGEPQMHALFARMDEHLTASPVIFEFLHIMEQVAALPRPLAPLQRIFLRSAVGLLPSHIITRLDLLDWQPSKADLRMAKLAAGGAEHIVLRQSPAALSSVRMGKPANWAWRRGA